MSTTDYQPNIAIHPGKTLEDTLLSLSMTQADLAERTGLAKKTINEIVKHKNPITPETAIKFASVFGTSVTFWNNLQRAYEESLVRIKAEKELEYEIELLPRFTCYRELAECAYVEKSRNPKHKVLNLHNFFGVSSLRYVSKIQATAFRKAKHQNMNYESLAAWLRCGEIEAQKMDLGRFNKDIFHDAIKDIRALTTKTKKAFNEILPDMLASLGVALVFVPYFKNTHVNGATKWLNSDNAIIQLSLRGKTEDGLWHTLFHELCHILKHGKKEQFIEFMNSYEESSEEEKEAEEFACNTLIPKSKYANFIKKNEFSYSAVRKFAHDIKVSPSIVAGRLSHDFEDWTTWSGLRYRTRSLGDGLL